MRSVGVGWVRVGIRVRAVGVGCWVRVGGCGVGVCGRVLLGGMVGVVGAARGVGRRGGVVCGAARGGVGV